MHNLGVWIWTVTQIVLRHHEQIPLSYMALWLSSGELLIGLQMPAPIGPYGAWSWFGRYSQETIQETRAFFFRGL